MVVQILLMCKYMIQVITSTTVTVNGSNNDIKAWQGKHEDGNVDNSETGDNDVIGL